LIPIQNHIEKNLSTVNSPSTLSINRQELSTILSTNLVYD
jgi:hypothetical protein